MVKLLEFRDFFWIVSFYLVSNSIGIKITILVVGKVLKRNRPILSRRHFLKFEIALKTEPRYSQEALTITLTEAGPFDIL